MSNQSTTAAFLNQFRTELEEGGCDTDLAQAIVRDAAHQIIREYGLQVGGNE